ncbi:uncharacterized protein LOC111829396 [Capsella rubella]|uniref:uncharacterized protein LOC111829396 n=1 Tax=Capsella rubella TaxID=81985 RepID=UPI000CD59F7D|nr:uncharacterized protein LOC111829396 [Capsella rubella]
MLQDKAIKSMKSKMKSFMSKFSCASTTTAFADTTPQDARPVQRRLSTSDVPARYRTPSPSRHSAYEYREHNVSSSPLRQSSPELRASKKKEKRKKKKAARRKAKASSSHLSEEHHVEDLTMDQAEDHIEDLTVDPGAYHFQDLTADPVEQNVEQPAEAPPVPPAPGAYTSESMTQYLDCYFQ